MCGKTIKSSSDNRTKHPLLHDEDWLYQKLIEEQRTYREVAQIVGCTFQRVQQRLRELGWGHLRRKKKPMTPKQRQILETLKSGDLTRKEIAEACDVTPAQVGAVVQKYGIRPARRGRNQVLTDPDWLYQKCIKEQLTYKKVGELAGCAIMTVYRRVRELGWLEERPRWGRKEPPEEQEQE